MAFKDIFRRRQDGNMNGEYSGGVDEMRGGMIDAGAGQPMAAMMSEAKIGKAQIKKAADILRKYKGAKANLEKR